MKEIAADRESGFPDQQKHSKYSDKVLKVLKIDLIYCLNSLFDYACSLASNLDDPYFECH